jgi:hypothetical protein
MQRSGSPGAGCAPPTAAAHARLRAAPLRPRPRRCARAAALPPSTPRGAGAGSTPWVLAGAQVAVPRLGGVHAHVLAGMAAASLGRDAAWATARLAALSALLPGAEDALLRLRVPELAALMASDDALLARRLVELRCAPRVRAAQANPPTAH